MEIPRRREEFGARREHYKQLELLFTVSIFYWVIGRNKAIEKIPHHPVNSLPGPDTVDIILTPPRTVNVQRYSYFSNGMVADKQTDRSTLLKYISSENVLT